MGTRGAPAANMVPVNLATIIEDHPADAVALVSRGLTTTYGELREQVGALRGGLQALGVQPGDRVAIVCANNWYFVASWFAVLGVGAVSVPLNPGSPTAELTRELAEVGAVAVIVGPAGRKPIAAIDRSALPELRHLVVSGADDTSGPGVVSFEELLVHEPAPLVPRADDDVAVLVFTSGTAGSPRAAMLSHGNIAANVEQIRAKPERRQSSDDVSLGLLPFNHAFGLTVVLAGSLTAGASLVLIERFDPHSLFETVSRHGVTVMAGAPAMWTALANLPTAPPGTFATVRLATSGADRLPLEVAQHLQQRYGLVVCEGYGLTEAGPAVTSSIGEVYRAGSVGAPLDGIDLRLVDEDGTDTLVGDPGELWVRGDNVFLGYWNDPDATATVLQDGWLRTGDVATVDDDGFLFLVDRAKDLIIVSGFNVYPAEVEEVLCEHAAVAECAVVGVPHPYSGEAVKAYVVVHDGASCEEDELIGWCADHLARYKCPAKIMFVSELPHGLHGKVLRRELR